LKNYCNYLPHGLNFAGKIEIMTNRTFTMIKPDATEKGSTGGILEMINAAGFRIVAMKMTHLSKEKAGQFYEVHKERPFYGELVAFMSRGPITAAILEKENAAEDFRKLIGATNPANAEEGTIRKKYASSIGENAVHGSDSDDNAKIEGDFFFSRLEQF
jgi:nucleoside-diphosphate kinase